MSVFVVDLVTNKVKDKFKTGYQIGQIIEGAEVVGGASPNSIAVGREFAYITNATNVENTRPLTTLFGAFLSICLCNTKIERVSYNQ